MSTIRDTARLAGVSPAAVSRVMNGTARVDIGKYAAGEPCDTDCVFDVTLIERETTRRTKGGERLEFTITGIEYGQLVEGDRGELTFQGTRYIAFTRK